MRDDAPPIAVPNHVALIGLGVSARQYLELTKRLGGRRAFCDETWTINALGDVYASDRVFHMDDVRVQEARAKARPESNIARMLEWMKTYPGVVLTSRAHPDYRCLVEYPLKNVIQTFGQKYFNSTAAYAVAYALYIGVKKLSIFGFDFTYDNCHHREKGRGCVEFWLGMATAHGMEVRIPHESSLMDACEWRLYGYDTVDVTFRRDDHGGFEIDMVPHDRPVDAEEIEARYDHSATAETAAAI